MKILRENFKLFVFTLLLTACSERANNATSDVNEASEDSLQHAPQEIFSAEDIVSNEIDMPKQGNLGEAIFDEYCAGCHNPGDGHPGTMRLAARIDSEHAVLVERKDLAPAYITQIVRNGIGMMPAFRPTEITDSSLVQLASFVAQNYSSLE